MRRFLEKFSDIDLVVFVVENADEVRLILVRYTLCPLIKFLHMTIIIILGKPVWGTVLPSNFCDRLEIQQPQFKSHSNHCCMYCFSILSSSNPTSTSHL